KSLGLILRLRERLKVGRRQPQSRWQAVHPATTRAAPVAATVDVGRCTPLKAVGVPGNQEAEGVAIRDWGGRAVPPPPERAATRSAGMFPLVRGGHSEAIRVGPAANLAHRGRDASPPDNPSGLPERLPIHFAGLHLQEERREYDLAQRCHRGPYVFLQVPIRRFGRLPRFEVLRRQVGWPRGGIPEQHFPAGNQSEIRPPPVNECYGPPLVSGFMLRHTSQTPGRRQTPLYRSRHFFRTAVVEAIPKGELRNGL